GSKRRRARANRAAVSHVTPVRVGVVLAGLGVTGALARGVSTRVLAVVGPILGRPPCLRRLALLLENHGRRRPGGVDEVGDEGHRHSLGEQVENLLRVAGGWGGRSGLAVVIRLES